MLNRAGSCWGLPVSKGTEAVTGLEKNLEKKTANPINFRCAPMVTTVVRSAGDRTRGIWKFLEMVCQTDTGVRLAEVQHSSLNQMLNYCVGRVPIYVHPSLYRSLKVRFPLDVGGLSRDGRVTTELGRDSLRQAIDILNPEDFWAIVDTDFKRCHFKCEGTEGCKQVTWLLNVKSVVR